MKNGISFQGKVALISGTSPGSITEPVTSALLATGHAEFAEQLLSEAVADFMANGIYEDVDYGFPAHSKGVLNYTASATNVLWAAKRLHQWRSRVAS